MDSGVFVFFLPVILAFMMMGLGLELTVKDFLRVGRYPKAIFLALFCQLVILTSIAFFICVVLDLEPLLAVGLMLLAASPGGPTANLLSFLFKGDVALNLTLTAINSVITTFTLPFIVNLSLHYFMQSDTTIGIQADKFAYIFLIIFIPVCIGLLIRHYFPHLALKCNRPMRMLCILFLTAIFIYALFRERSNVILYFVDVGIAVGIFCFSSMFIGYLVPHLAGLTERQARACTFEIGIHNTAISITIAISVLSSTTIAIPAGVYSIYMYLFAFGFGYILTRKKSNLLSNQVKP
ncbi:bile acid:sodium symporter family protein [Acinetobacter cumulans]|uniref:Bile acid:sodium symporter family protein n=1 Tax=Acinetobacter cumulans TaxID=2136182 RepID=A0A498D736_9GAMM|nr:MULTISPECIES: bile acid:sodium symporter family protein [Acinetobacter]RFS32645.1 bile acid:sodium symporter family protein [Acinetobacter sp. SWAC5]RKG45202.1 bile acid:sodium symporter family protein [Acinetobacter cumulans]RLL34573.1 bile acid:sodium symporter family protein [Acinetobacter cumulans]RZG60058.1 bile acid:sodium symporter family protein [Acinetobacter sp. WCHAc060006]